MELKTVERITAEGGAPPRSARRQLHSTTTAGERRQSFYLVDPAEERRRYQDRLAVIRAPGFHQHNEENATTRWQGAPAIQPH
jgi:hypothetical protein